ncbi:MAG: uroporphyrinogen-III synthase [Waddliaceae bacterium]
MAAASPQNSLFPLAGYRVVVLRAVEQAYELKKALLSLGAQVIACPMIECKEIPSASGQLSSSFLQPFQIVIFTSANGVKFFMQALDDNAVAPGDLVDKKFVVVGPQTAAALNSYGLTPDLVAKTFVAEGILDLLVDDLKDKNILILTARGARKTLSKELKKRGANVVVVTLYTTTRPKIDEVPIQDGDIVLFTSSSTAGNFFESPLYQEQKIVSFCIGEITKATVQKYIADGIHVSKEATCPSLVQAVVEYIPFVPEEL